MCCASRSPELLYVGERRRPAGLKLGCPPSEINVLGENPHDGRLVGGSMACVCGQQHLLLNPKVLAALAVPELQEHPSGVSH